MTDAGDWLDAALGKVKLGPLTTPWVASGALSLGASAHCARRPGTQARGARGPGSLRLRPDRQGVRVQGSVAARRKDFVGWVYADPEGPSTTSLTARSPTCASKSSPTGRRRPSWRWPVPRTSSACASATTASRSSRSRTARERAAPPATPGRRAGSGSGRAGGWAVLPELPCHRREPVTAPVLAHRQVAGCSSLELVHALLQPLAARHRAALRRGQRAQLALARAAARVRLGLRAQDADHPALDAHLAPQLGPVEQQRRLRVGLELFGLAAAVVGEEDDAAPRRSPWSAPCAPTGERPASRWRAQRRRARMRHARMPPRTMTRTGRAGRDRGPARRTRGR